MNTNEYEFAAKRARYALALRSLARPQLFGGVLVISLRRPLCPIRRALLAAPLLAAPLLFGCSPDPEPAEQLAREASALVAVPQQKLFAADGAKGDWFGFGTALDKDTAVIGATYSGIKGPGSGAAHIFTRSGGVWTLEQELFAEGAMSGSAFGFSADIEGDTAIISAPLDNNEKGNMAGAVYVFTRSGGVWTMQQKLVPSDAALDDRFGNAVAIDGDTLVATAWGHDLGLMGEIGDAGAAYVFTRSGGVWEQQAKLVAGDAASPDHFGYSIAIDNDTIFVGALENDAESVMDSGAVYVFTRDGGTWTQTQKLVADKGAMAKDVTVNGYFGGSVSIDGDSAAVGATGALNMAKTDVTGAIYMFTRSGGTWTPQQKLVPDDLVLGDNLGYRVSLSGDALVTSSHWHASQSGAVYVFTQSGGAWAQRDKMVDKKGYPFQWFGIGLSYSGDTIIVGAAGDDEFGEDLGAASVFVLRGSDGEACTGGAQCLSGFCADGVCCDKACGGGPCDACAKAMGASADGVCTPFPGAACNDGDACTQVDGCDASGVCDGASPVVCASDDACQIPGACDPATGVCTVSSGEVCTEDGKPAAPPDVIPCSTAAECASGFCVDGVCCDSACEEPCHSCVLFPNLGKCTLSPAGVDLRLDCYPVLNCLRTCGGNGQCIGAGAGVQCAPNRCVTRSGGLGPAVCAAVVAECPVEESVPFDCAPYVCEPAFGACRFDCRANDHCAEGYACDITGVCITPPPVQQVDQGCAIVVSGRSAGSGIPWLLALAALIRVRARARVSRSPRPCPSPYGVP
jgi:hypothetical protein